MYKVRTMFTHSPVANKSHVRFQLELFIFVNYTCVKQRLFNKAIKVSLCLELDNLQSRTLFSPLRFGS